MNTLIRITPLLLVSSVFASLLHAEPVSLVSEDFNEPTELTFRFPEEPGKPTRYHGQFGGWAQEGGVIAITYGDGYGPDKSGAMHCVVKQPSPVYIVAQRSQIALPLANLADVSAAHGEAFSLEFDADIPAGKIITIFLQPVGPEDMRAREWASRIVFGRITGVGAYKRYSLAGAEGDSAANFARFAKDAALNGAKEIRANLVFSLAAQAWDEGDAFQLDNLNLTFTRP